MGKGSKRKTIWRTLSIGEDADETVETFVVGGTSSLLSLLLLLMGAPFTEAHSKFPSNILASHTSHDPQCIFETFENFQWQ